MNRKLIRMDYSDEEEIETTDTFCFPFIHSESRQYWNALVKVMYSHRMHKHHLEMLRSWALFDEATQEKILADFQHQLKEAEVGSNHQVYLYLLKFGLYRGDPKSTTTERLDTLQQLETHSVHFNYHVRKNLLVLFHLLVGNSYSEKKQYRMAKKYYQKAIQIEPMYSDAYFNKGITYTEQGKMKKAIKFYNKAIKLNPSDARLFNNRGYVHHETRKYYNAVRDFSYAIELNPRNAKAYNNRGVAYSAMGQYYNAIEDYTSAIEINEKFANAYNNRANAHSHLNNIELALADYQKAIEIDPGNGAALMNRERLCKKHLKVQENTITHHQQRPRTLSKVLQKGSSSNHLTKSYTRF
jgi:tetratricopeptide (TPR) repeat protein